VRRVDGHYWLPILPKDIAEQIDALPPGIRDDRAKWPKELREEYKRLHAYFTRSKAEFLSWLRKDRDSRMTATAKEITRFLVESLNFDTGRCDPSHQLIADELGYSVRTVERLVPRIAESGWMAVTRRGKTSTNFYRFRVATAKVNALLDLSETLRERRKNDREERRRQFLMRRSDPTRMADHSTSDPTTMADHEPTSMTGHEPTRMSGKPLNRTLGEEPLNEAQGSEGEGDALHAGHHESLKPFTPPEDDADVEEMVMSWLEGCPPRIVLQLFDHLRNRLMTGDFTPAELTDLIRRAA
jgi:hypothetical protein